jgi:hypothetical protein
MKQLLLFALTGLMALPVSGQLAQVSFGGHFYRQTGNTIISFDPGTSQGTVYYLNPIEEKRGIPGFGFYYYHPLFKPSNNFSVGGQTAFAFWAFFQSPDAVQNQYGQTIGSTGGSPLEIGYNMPLMAMTRFGAHATEDSNEGFGGGLGAGFMLFGFSVPNDKGFMIPFALSAEVNYNNFGLRFDLPLKKYESFYKSYTGDIPRVTSSFYSVQLTLALTGD